MVTSSSHLRLSKVLALALALTISLRLIPYSNTPPFHDITFSDDDPIFIYSRSCFTRMYMIRFSRCNEPEKLFDHYDEISDSRAQAA